jgi:UDP-N-acetylmuramate: L-alanyl-gamma-D-glutamyl-meso-diaminopimelate ligase
MSKHDYMLPKNAHIHLMGICGVGMSSLAGMLAEKGYTITGSDHNVYPPISTFLEKISLPVKKGYSPTNLHPVPHLVIVGNVITRTNPEAVELLRLGIPYLSMPEAMKKLAMNGTKSLIIAGTHGKTTTSALTAWILEHAGMDPSFMIGGIARNFDTNFRLGKGPFFVIEGDEYDTAFFDKRPKFVHYAPSVVAITSIEFDHADIYTAIDEIKEAFRNLVELIPTDGFLCGDIDNPAVAEAIKKAKCPTVTYGLTKGANFSIRDATIRDDMTRVTVIKKDEEVCSIATPLYGNHNIRNILAAICLANHLEISCAVIAEAMATFTGVKRRLEVLATYDDIVVIDDFAHHPTSVRETTKAVKTRYKDRRLVAVFEPRSNSSRRNIFQNDYAFSFDSADLVILPEPPMMDKIPPAERFSSVTLAEGLSKRGIQARYCADNDQLLNELLSLTKPGDVILIMSNGAFDHIQERLVGGLKERASRGSV